MIVKKLTIISSAIVLSIIGAKSASAQWVPLDTTPPYYSPLGLSAPWAFPVLGPFLLDGVNYRSTDTGKTWAQDSVSYYAGGNTTCFVVVGSIIYAGNASRAGFPGIIFSTDSGADWAWLTDIVPYDNISGYNNGINALTSIGANLIAGTDSGVFISTDSGADWIRANTGLGNDSTCIDAFQWIGSTLYAGSNGENPYAQAVGGIFRSSDSGKSWLSPGQGGPSVFTLASNGQTIYAGTYGVYITSDSGSTWAPFNDGYSNNFDNSVYSIVFVDGTILVATDAGIFLSLDNGGNWADFNQGVPGPDIGATSIAIYGQYLFAGLGNDAPGGYEVWRRPLSDVPQSGVASDSPPMNSVTLTSYPNPITSTTTISFTLPAAGQVTLTLTDAAGREWPLMPAQYLSSGQHEVAWNVGADGNPPTPSGVYLLRLEACGESAMQRVVVMH